VLDMMALEKTSVVAARERAPVVIAGAYGSGDRRGHDPGFAADSERLVVVRFFERLFDKFAGVCRQFDCNRYHSAVRIPPDAQ
jgi:hypothetical protein